MSDDGTLGLRDAKLRSQIKFVNLAVGQSRQVFLVTNELSNAAKARCMDANPKAVEVAKSLFNGSVRVYANPYFQEKKFSR